MNIDPADTRHPHLDLADLIAGAAGQPVGDRVREHLADCEHCQLEANRWNLVADGIGKNCSPGSITQALGVISAAPVSAG